MQKDKKIKIKNVAFIFTILSVIKIRNNHRLYPFSVLTVEIF